MVVCDKALIAKTIPDNASAFVYTSNQGTQIKQPLTHLDFDKIAGARASILPKAIYQIKDTIFEKGNFATASHGDQIVLFQKQLQLALTIQLKHNTFEYAYSNLAISKPEYSMLSNLIEGKKHLPFFPYDSAAVRNRKAKLPMQTVSAINIDGNKVQAFKSVYFYFLDQNGNLANKGFDFLEELGIGANQELVPGQAIILEPFILPDSALVGFFIFYKHQRLGENRYFSYYNLYNDKENRFKIENRYFGGVYSIQDGSISVEKHYKIGQVEMSDSLQIVLRKFAYGNSPVYFSIDQQGYVLYKNFAQVLDLQTGTLTGLRDFLKLHTQQDLGADFNFIYDFVMDSGGFKIAYLDQQKLGSVQYAAFSPGKGLRQVQIERPGNFDYLSIGSDQILMLTKMEEKNLIEIKLFEE
jgi:hypothetical protein